MSATGVGYPAEDDQLQQTAQHPLLAIHILRVPTLQKQLKSMFESDTYYHPRLDLSPKALLR